MLAAFALVNAGVQSTGTATVVPAIPFPAFATLAALWLAANALLTSFGAWLASRQPVCEWPVRCTLAAAPLAGPQASLTRKGTTAKAILCVALSGFLPFAVMFLQLWFAMASAWLGYFYALYGMFATASALVIAVTCVNAAYCTCALHFLQHLVYEALYMICGQVNDTFNVTNACSFVHLCKSMHGVTSP